MDITAVIIYIIFFIALIWYSYQVWFNHEAFLKNVRSFRASFYNNPLGSLARRLYGNALDKDPKLELWLARTGLILIYFLVIYVFSLYQK